MLLNLKLSAVYMDMQCIALNGRDSEPRVHICYLFASVSTNSLHPQHGIHGAWPRDVNMSTSSVKGAVGTRRIIRQLAYF